MIKVGIQKRGCANDATSNFAYDDGGLFCGAAFEGDDVGGAAVAADELEVKRGVGNQFRLQAGDGEHGERATSDGGGERCAIENNGRFAHGVADAGERHGLQRRHPFQEICIGYDQTGNLAVGVEHYIVDRLCRSVFGFRFIRPPGCGGSHE